MTSALVASTPSPDEPDLVRDLQAAGVHVVGATGLQDLVHRVVRDAPDVVVCWDRSPDAGFFDALAAVDATAPLPIVVFTADHSAEKIERSTESGVHAYVVGGYGSERLRATIRLAQARFRRERALRDRLDDVTKRFEERKLVDRAKGILMRARQISEDDAFRILRTTSMHSKQRVGRISQRVIDAARDAEGLNRTGQLRMLSQRLAKSAALVAAGDVEDGTALRDDTVGRIDRNLDALGRMLSQPTFGDLLGAVVEAWRPLKTAAMAATLRPSDVDALAEALLERAERLTAYLRTVGANRSLRVIDISGRQRMLAQRYAKQALLADTPAEACEATRVAFEEGLAYLRSIPLTSREIAALLDDAVEAWDRLLATIPEPRDAARRARLSAASETLLDLFDRLTDQYERSMQILIG